MVQSRTQLDVIKSRDRLSTASQRAGNMGGYILAEGTLVACGGNSAVV